MSRRTRWLAIAVGVPIVVYALFGNPLDPFDNRRFSADAWRAAGLNARARMSRDVMKRVVRPGMPEKQVVALLGAPARVGDRRGPSGDPLPDTRIYEYYIGSWTFQRMDDAFLYVHIDPSDRVLTTEIYGY